MPVDTQVTLADGENGYIGGHACPFYTALFSLLFFV